jgi:hypothetical protein
MELLLINLDSCGTVLFPEKELSLSCRLGKVLLKNMLTECISLLTVVIVTGV